MTVSLSNFIFFTILVIANSFVLVSQNNYFNFGNDIGQRFVFKNKKSETFIKAGEFKELYIDTIGKEFILPNALLSKSLFCMLANIDIYPNDSTCEKLTGPFDFLKIHHSHSKYIKIAAYIGKIEKSKLEFKDFYLSDLLFAYKLFNEIQSSITQHNYILYLSIHISLESVYSDKPVTTIINVYKLSNLYNISSVAAWGLSYIDHLEVYTSLEDGIIKVR